MKLISILVFLFAFTAQAKVCDLSQTLTKKQIKLLKKAQKLKRFGPNRSLFGKNVYKVDLLSNDDKLLVLVGEAHIKGPRSSRLGKKIVKAFYQVLSKYLKKSQKNINLLNILPKELFTLILLKVVQQQVVNLQK